MQKLYYNIKYFREAQGLSQDELAKKTGYTSRSSIARIEAGEIDIPQSKISAFASALGTTPAVLMGWDDNSDNPGPVIQAAAAHFDTTKLTPEGRKMYEDYITYLAEKYFVDDEE